MGYMARHYEPSVRIDYSELDEAIEHFANVDGDIACGVALALITLRNHRFNTADQFVELVEQTIKEEE